jgi:hypothetical protein
MDDPNKRGSQDRDRIAVGQEHELRYWSKKFEVSREDLIKAVREVGNNPARVEAYLRDRRH